jgi:hypothetical protein
MSFGSIRARSLPNLSTLGANAEISVNPVDQVLNDEDLVEVLLRISDQEDPIPTEFCSKLKNRAARGRQAHTNKAFNEATKQPEINEEQAKEYLQKIGIHVEPGVVPWGYPDFRSCLVDVCITLSNLKFVGFGDPLQTFLKQNKLFDMTPPKNEKDIPKLQSRQDVAYAIEDIHEWEDEHEECHKLWIHELYGPICNWDVSNVTDLCGIFEEDLEFNQPLNRWNVCNVENMSGLFANATSFDQPLDQWDVSRVTNMRCMFYYADSFNRPLNAWGKKLGSVTDMSDMFCGAQAFNQPLNQWDVSKVVTMERMFFMAISYKQSFEGWNLHSLENFNELFDVSAMDDWDRTAFIIAHANKGIVPERKK